MLNVVNKKINVDNDIVGCVEEEKNSVQIYSTIYFVTLCSGCCWLLLLLLLMVLLLTSFVRPYVFFSCPFFFLSIERHYNMAELLLFQLQLPNTVVRPNFNNQFSYSLSHSLFWIKILPTILTSQKNTSAHTHAMVMLTRNANEPLK